ncbi:MAG: hypothetical protein HQK57_12740 [Deltaproteobacteria bacterium]|nr:hypothetical protein [Deltaproteobacteria bacterium]MBF0527635.1 hypothetical protein [Deltaproteobacteria bacterium]
MKASRGSPERKNDSLKEEKGFIAGGLIEILIWLKTSLTRKAWGKDSFNKTILFLVAS